MQTPSATIDRSIAQSVHPQGRFEAPLRRGACLEGANGESLKMRDVRQFTNRSSCRGDRSAGRRSGPKAKCLIPRVIVRAESGQGWPSPKQRRLHPRYRGGADESHQAQGGAGGGRGSGSMAKMPHDAGVHGKWGERKSRRMKKPCKVSRRWRGLYSNHALGRVVSWPH